MARAPVSKTECWGFESLLACLYNLMIARFKNYIQGINQEWQRVSKPDMKEVQGSTITVIIACAFLGLYIGLVDGNSAFPEWNNPLSWIFLVILPIAVFFIGRSWENQPQSSREAKSSDENKPNQKVIAAAIACIPLMAVLVSQYVLNNSLEGFGMAFLRTLFIR